METSNMACGATLEVVRVVARLDDDEAPEPLDPPDHVLAGPLPAPTISASAPEAAPHMAWDGSTFVAQMSFPVGTSFYGTGERAGPLERTGLRAETWNTDAYAYDDHTPALYQSQPAVLAVHADGRATFVVACTARRSVVVTGTDGVEIAVAGAPCVLLRIEAPDPATAVSGLTELFGRPAEVPRWALGYHQCRWSYMSAEEVRTLVQNFDHHDIPLSAVWLDIDYMDRFRVFTVDAEAFPDLPALVHELVEAGLRAVAIIDPGLAIADDYEVAQQARADGHLVLDRRGRPVEGRVWPGRCWFPDFTREQTRSWWAGLVERFVTETKVAGLWCDMNEPSVFSTPTQTLPEDAVHRGLGGGPHARFHNLYGQLMVEATRAGLEAVRPHEPPFVLTRAAHLATPRSAATWTGDNLSTWDDLRWSVTMVLGLGLVGQAMAGPDVGGFSGDPGPELFARWFEVGCYFPFFRGHADQPSPRKEPWSFGEEALARVRASIRWRMRLLPFLQDCFQQAHITGVPAARPLFFADPVDSRLRAIDSAFLLGPNLLVVPALEPGTPTRELPLPAGSWKRVPVGALLADPAATTSRHIELEGPVERGTIKIEIPAGPAPCFLREGAQLHLAPIMRRPPAFAKWPVLETLCA